MIRGALTCTILLPVNGSLERREGGGAVQPMSNFDTTLLKHQKSSQPFEKGLLSPQVNGFDVTDVPQQMFFDLLRAAEKVAKIQILKIPVSKV